MDKTELYHLDQGLTVFPMLRPYISMPHRHPSR